MAAPRCFFMLGLLPTAASLLSVLAAAEPLPTAGSEQTLVVHALMALSRGDTAPLTALPAHLIDEAPAVVDPADDALARRWTTLLPAATVHLPAAQRTAVLTALDAWFAQAGHTARPWDYLPAPTAAEAVTQAAATAFDHGRLAEALALAADGPRADAARTLLATPLPPPALPVPGDGPLPTAAPARLLAGDGWLFGLDPAGRVRWQRRCERQAQVVIGRDAALVVEAAGASVVAADGSARRLPPLPSFAKPWAVTATQAWFVAGSRIWRVALGPQLLSVTAGDLGTDPLGPPLLRGDDAWWLTRQALLTTHGIQITERLPHLLALSSRALLQAHPRGGIIRDGQRWWQIDDRITVPPLARGEALLLTGEWRTAATCADATPPGRDLAFRCTLADPDARIDTWLATAQTPQQQAIAWLACWKIGSAAADDALRTLATAHPDLLITEPGTNLALPIAAWPLRTTLAAWASSDRNDAQITVTSDATRVLVRAQWTEHRWWERSWPTRPLLDAPSRAWALTSDATGVTLVIVDGSEHLLLLDARTGDRQLEADVPVDLDPAAVIRCGHGAAALVDQGHAVLLISATGVIRQHLANPGRSLRTDGDTLIVVSDHDELRVPLMTPAARDH